MPGEKYWRYCLKTSDLVCSMQWSSKLWIFQVFSLQQRKPCKWLWQKHLMTLVKMKYYYSTCCLHRNKSLPFYPVMKHRTANTSPSSAIYPSISFRPTSLTGCHPSVYPLLLHSHYLNLHCHCGQLHENWNIGKVTGILLSTHAVWHINPLSYQLTHPSLILSIHTM